MTSLMTKIAELQKAPKPTPTPAPTPAAAPAATPAAAFIAPAAAPAATPAIVTPEVVADRVTQMKALNAAKGINPPARTAVDAALDAGFARVLAERRATDTPTPPGAGDGAGPRAPAPTPLEAQYAAPAPTPAPTDETPAPTDATEDLQNSIPPHAHALYGLEASAPPATDMDALDEAAYAAKYGPPTGLTVLLDCAVAKGSTPDAYLSDILRAVGAELTDEGAASWEFSGSGHYVDKRARFVALFAVRIAEVTGTLVGSSTTPESIMVLDALTAAADVVIRGTR